VNKPQRTQEIVARKATPAGGGTPPLLELHDVRRLYPNGDTIVRALDGVSLTIEAGEFVAIMGPSGSGKSTLMNILGCLDRPTSGTYRVAGHDVSKLSLDELAALRCRTFGFVFQRFNLLPQITAAENVENRASVPRPRTAFAARPRRPHRAQADRTLRRPAAACLDRARADERGAGRAGGRADRRARQPLG
jgi:macrolide transport system ATP-binding/permease protein